MLRRAPVVAGAAMSHEPTNFITTPYLYCWSANRHKRRDNNCLCSCTVFLCAYHKNVMGSNPFIEFLEKFPHFFTSRFGLRAKFAWQTQRCEFDCYIGSNIFRAYFKYLYSHFFLLYIDICSKLSGLLCKICLLCHPWFCDVMKENEECSFVYCRGKLRVNVPLFFCFM